MYVPQMIYVRGSGDVRTDLLSALHAHGYAPHVFTGLDEVVKLCAFGSPALIIVDASAGEAEASQRFVELSSAGVLQAVPIVFISRQATKRSVVLKKQFQTFIAVDVPFRMNALLEALQKICPPERRGEPSAAQAESRPESAPAALEKISPTAPEILAISKPDPSNLVASYGGELLAQAADASHFDDALLIPAHPAHELIATLLGKMAERNPWLGAHVRRTAFVASAVANNLELGTERDASIRIAGLLLNWGSSESRDLVQHDVFLTADERMLVTLADAFEQSAHQLRERLQDDLAIRIMIAMANTLRARPVSEDPNVVFDAQCTLATELVDRACWSNGSWNAFGAHRSLRKLAQGEPIPFDRLVVESLKRIIVEAATARQPAASPIAIEDFPDRQLIEEALKEAQTLFAGREQVGLKIIDLKPGMRLSMPLLSLDGRLLLRSNTFLDQEMIWRIWKLASIRAVKPPIHVLGQFGK